MSSTAGRLPDSAAVNSSDPMDLPQKLRSLRLRSGLTQVGLAQHLGVNNRQVSHIESGRHSPSVEVLEKWAIACGAQLALVDEAQLSDEDADIVADLVAALRAGVLDERRKKFLRMELREYLGDVATSKKAEAG